MTVNRKVTGTTSSIPSGLAIGVLSAVVTTFMGILLASILIDNEIIKWRQSGYAVMIILIISSWIGAEVAANKIKRRRLMVCVVSAIGYFVALLMITGLFFGGKYSGVGESGLLILCGSTLGIIVKYPGKSERKRRKIRRRHG